MDADSLKSLWLAMGILRGRVLDIQTQQMDEVARNLAS
jgi:hypothetical protein